MELRRALFLDRDGVINRVFMRDGKPYPPKNRSELVILEGVHEAIQKFKEAGFLVIVMTNQPDVARGTASRAVIEDMNQFLVSQLGLDHVYVCYHDDKDQCHCRKPQPGMIFTAQKQFQIDLSKSIVVGDRWRDIEAGKRAGCKTYLIDYEYPETAEKGCVPDFSVKSLYEVMLDVLRLGK